MRIFSFVFIILIFLSGCRQQQERPTDVVPDEVPVVVDYPAGVMIRAEKQENRPADANAFFAKKILSAHSIPLLDTIGPQLEFVTKNGDRVILRTEQLAGKYDIVLFDAVNNPVPLRIKDLQGAVDQIFSGEVKKRKAQSLLKPKVVNKTPQFNGQQQPGEWNPFTNLKNRDKKIIITSSDTATNRLTSRIFPGVQWVEHRLDQRTILKVNFENDLITYANTDRYFTNGVTIELQAAWLSRSPFAKLMIPYRNNAYKSYSLSMVQDMYTPTDTRVAPALNHDRPYASYLYFGLRQVVADPLRKLKITSQVDAGYIGPYSPGSYMQTLVHKTFPTNDEPLGWETQINTDVILNYGIQVQKAFVNNRNLTLLGGVNLNAGTLYNKAGAGFELQAGRAEPVFGLAEKENWPLLEYYFFAKTNAGIVAYNALLQGGMFNHENTFTLNGNDIRRLVGSAEAGIHVRYKGVGIEIAQHYLSPEYKGGLWHKWGRMSLMFGL